MKLTLDSDIEVHDSTSNKGCSALEALNYLSEKFYGRNLFS